MRRILVDTSPVNAFSRGSINLGLEIVATEMQKTGGLKRCHYLDVLSPAEVGEADEICFCVPYALHALNIVPFLKRNGIELLREKRRGSPLVIVGGSAIHPLPSLEEIVDEQFLGEYEGCETDSHGYHRCRDLNDSEVYIQTEKYRGLLAPLNKDVVVKEAVVELARGCPNSCLFCEYRYIVGGKYREKPFGLLERQLESLHPKDSQLPIPHIQISRHQKLVKRLTIRTSNLSACTYLPDLSTLCQGLNRKLLWAEVSPPDANKMIDFLEPLGITRINFGVESFTESVRKKMCKPIKDDELAILLRVLMQKLSFIKINLIYGLPGEGDYEPWFSWLQKIAEIRKHIRHPVRIDFAISNLELGGLSGHYLREAFPAVLSDKNFSKGKIDVGLDPKTTRIRPNAEKAQGVPAAELATPIDFVYKENVFLPGWVSVLRELDLSYRNADLFPKDTDASGNCRIHGRDFGRSGRTELNHLVIIALRNLPASVITDALLSCFPNGAHRYFSQHQAKSFLNKLKFN